MQTLLDITIRIPSMLRSYTENREVVVVQASTPREAIGSLCSLYPELSANLTNQSGELRDFVNVFVDSKRISNHDSQFDDALEEGGTLTLMLAVAGG